MRKIYLYLTFLLILKANHCISQELLVAKKVGSDSPASMGDQGNSIVVDNDGNQYVTGIITYGTSGVTFGKGEANERVIYMNGAFIAKYTANGELIWVKEIGAYNNSVISYAIDIDTNNNVYVTGQFHQDAIFGYGEENETSLSGIQGEIFVAKYDTNGKFIWAKGAGGNKDEPGGMGIVVDNSNVYVTGSFWDSATFGKGEVNETTLVGHNTEIFVSSYDLNGNLQWVRKAGGSDFDGGKKIDVDEIGNIYVTGNYFNAATFGEGLPNETILNDENESAFIAKYDNNGAFIWAIAPFMSGTGDISEDVKVDKEGNILFTGCFFGTIRFNPATDHKTFLSSAGSNDIILAKYNPAGKLVWATSARSKGDDRGHSIDIDNFSNIFLTGYYGSDIQFGADERNDTTLTNAGFGDMFLAKFSSEGEFIWSTSAGGNQWEQGSDVAVDGSGNSYVTGFFRSDIIFGKGEANETSFSINGFDDFFIAKFKKSSNMQPEFEIQGNTTFNEDFSGPQKFTVNQVNTPSDEIDQVVTYSISPESTELFEFTFDKDSGALEITSSPDKFGEQTLTITADDGSRENYSFTKELTITITPVSDAPVISGQTKELTVSANSSVKILLADLIIVDPDNDSPDTYKLTVSPGPNYTVAENLVTPVVDFIGTLNVPVRVSNSTAESKEFTFNIKVEGTLDIDNSIIAKGFNVYPNPVTDWLYIHSNDDIKAYEAQIFTMQGKLVYSTEPIKQKDKSFDLKNLSPGLYILKIIIGDKYGTAKLFKK